MPHQVCTSAMMKCPFGLAPSVFNATPRPVLTDNKPCGVITDMVPIVNIPPFGMCNSPSNPMFIAATAAALGTPTPVPCLPVPTGPWAPGAPTVLIMGIPALNNTSKLICAWAGVIQFTTPGQFTHQIP